MRHVFTYVYLFKYILIYYYVFIPSESIRSYTYVGNKLQIVVFLLWVSFRSSKSWYFTQKGSVITIFARFSRFFFVLFYISCSYSNMHFQPTNSMIRKQLIYNRITHNIDLIKYHDRDKLVFFFRLIKWSKNCSWKKKMV